MAGRRPKRPSAPEPRPKPSSEPSSRPKRSKHRLFTVAAIVSSVALTLLVAEIGVRLYEEGGWSEAWGVFASGEVPFSDLEGDQWVIADPELGYRLNPAHSETNSLGLRNPEIELHKPSGVKRLVVVGDSVSADPEGYVTLLRRQLAGQFEVINGAVPGYTTYQERLLFEKHLLPLEPDLVVLQYCVNDNHRFLHRFDPEGGFLITEDARRALLLGEGDLLAWLPRSSYLASRLRLALVRERASSGEFHWQQFPDFATAWQDESWPQFRDELRAIQSAVTEAGALLTVIMPPYVPQIDPRLPQGSETYVFKPQSKMAAICKELDIPLLDLQPIYAEKGSWKLFRDILHFNEEGHRVTADAVREHLGKLGWLEGENN